VLPLEEISRAQFTAAKADKAQVRTLLSQDSFITIEGRQPHAIQFMYLVHENKYYRGSLRGYTDQDFTDTLLREKAGTQHIFVWERKAPVLPGEALPEAEPLPQRKKSASRRR